ncbi:MAG: DNA-binding transcriptional regulator [Akkermansiaceae bacterium]|nr:DNA-binding transcriptional regulator [Akkermansiaceae bacterium]
MKRSSKSTARRVAISLEMDWGFKRHLETYAGCQRYADEAGWDCIIHPAPDRVMRGGSKERPFDGVLARATPEMAAAARKAGIPLVNVWMNSPVEDVPSVYPDCRASGAMAAEHLIARGFRQFGYLGFLNDVDSRLQVQGFREVTKREGFPCTTYRFSRTSVEGRARGWEKFVAGLDKWIDSWEPPLGVFVCNDLFCRYLIDACRAKGLHVSQDVAILGCSNEPTICDAPPPSLTSIDLGFAQVGYSAAAILDRLMRGHKAPATPELVPPAELVPRQSTDVYAADDPVVARALRFIAESGHERIEVKEVVSAVATNRRSLERKFRESVGRSIGAEITRLRIERAKRRMVETDAPMKDVALDAGFRNADHFYKVFARVEGIPPTRYRDERQKVFPQSSENPE